MRRFAKSEGIAAFWRGNAGNIVRTLPEHVSLLLLNDRLARHGLLRPQTTDGAATAALKLVGAGLLATSIAIPIYWPVHTAAFNRVHLAAGSPEPWSIRALYRTLTPATVLAILGYRGLQLGGYNLAKWVLPADCSQRPLPQLAAASLVSVATAVVTNPLNVIQQAVARENYRDTPRFRSGLSALRHLLATEGAGSLMRGAGSRASIAAVLFPGVMVAYDQLTACWT